MLRTFDLLYHAVWQVATDVSVKYTVVPGYHHLPSKWKLPLRVKNFNHLPDCTVS